MNKNIINKFLVKAKINTYASGGEEKEKNFSDGSKGFEFRENDFLYIDKYFGSDCFIGKEIFFNKNQAIWGMNYYGRIVSKIIPEKEIYQFLQKALKKVTKNKPFRGPDILEINDLKYINMSKGNIDNFLGEEKILYMGKIVFLLDYHGGLIK